MIKRKLKLGDKVKCITSLNSYFTKGKIYTIKKYKQTSFNYVNYDQNENEGFNTDSTFILNNFILLETKRKSISWL